MKTVLITGCAGFIGSNLTDKLLSSNYKVVGVDNFDNYYSENQKTRNLELALESDNFKLYRHDLLDYDKIRRVFEAEKPEYVIHLAARAGVRPSLVDPLFYAKNNILSTTNILKLSSDFKIQRFIFGSSSSVYGRSENVPFSDEDNGEHLPISPYAASKLSSEYFVESFYRSLGLKSVIFRFFTVYGKRGRPDMAPAIFANSLLKNVEISQYGDGKSQRDYTFIDDVTRAIMMAIESDLEFAIINLGSDNPIKLEKFIKILEAILSKKAKIKKAPKQMGDVEKTWADIRKAKKLLGWKPEIYLEEGIRKYADWLMDN